jgi:hypothetical protein
MMIQSNSVQPDYSVKKDNFIALSTIPIPDDRIIFQVTLAGFSSACVAVANDLGIFDAMIEPVSSEIIAKRLNLSGEIIKAICLVLASDGLVNRSNGVYNLTETSRAYYTSNSLLYSGKTNLIIKNSHSYQKIATAAKRGWAPICNKNKSFTKMWENGDLSPEAAQNFTNRMHSVIFGPSLAEARSGIFQKCEHIIDAGGGSGALCIAVLAHHPEIKTTLMDLPQVCDAALPFLQTYELENKIRRTPCNFFKDPWPTDGDAYHFSNILHDWSFDIGVQLITNAFEALPVGGKLFIHEALLDESLTSPRETVIFNLLMCLNHKAQQYTENNMQRLIKKCGFINPKIVFRFGIYSTIMAIKP